MDGPTDSNAPRPRAALNGVREPLVLLGAALQGLADLISNQCLGLYSKGKQLSKRSNGVLCWPPWHRGCRVTSRLDFKAECHLPGCNGSASPCQKNPAPCFGIRRSADRTGSHACPQPPQPHHIAAVAGGDDGGAIKMCPARSKRRQCGGANSSCPSSLKAHAGSPPHRLQLPRPAAWSLHPPANCGDETAAAAAPGNDGCGMEAAPSAFGRDATPR